VNTLEQAHEILAPAFSYPDDIKLEFVDYHGHHAIKVTAVTEYQHPEYIGSGGLLGMTELFRVACGGDTIHHEQEVYRSGCETCDYGSLYGNIYIVYRG
jgi:hypothetical protein